MTPEKLSPVMNSRKLQALEFIQRYYIETRVQALIRVLERDGLVRRVRGKSRGIMLIGHAKHISDLDALLQLQRRGWTINQGRMELVPPLSCPSLPWPPKLDHISEVEIEDLHD